MSQVQYLVDMSAFARLVSNDGVAEAWRQQVTAGLLAVCPATELEILYTARSRSDRDRLRRLLGESFLWVAMPERAFERAAEVQSAMTDRGTHRSAGAVDLLVAATAESHQLTLLHYDADFVAVAEVTGQSVRWVAEPGTVD